MVNQKGTPVKPLGQGVQLPASFVGVHMEVADAVLSDQLPLLAAGSVVLPVSLQVGRAPGDAFEEVVVEVRGAGTVHISTQQQQQQLLLLQQILVNKSVYVVLPAQCVLCTLIVDVACNLRMLAVLLSYPRCSSVLFHCTYPARFAGRFDKCWV